MKKFYFTLLSALVATVALQAQQISVVKAGSTTLHGTLTAAIEAAADGSVIYLPGGGFPINDTVKINKKLTIIGIGHKVKGDNADGYTTISGNLFFDSGSDGSAVMGTYITGNVYIGNDGNQVDEILVRYCNLNTVQVKNNKCLRTEVNQNYIRNTSQFNGASALFTNNIAHSVNNLDNGLIINNVITSTASGSYVNDCKAISNSDNTSIKGNVILSWGGYGPQSGSNCLTSQNMLSNSWGDDCYNMSGIQWADVFAKNAGVTPASDYHFKGDYQKYSTTCGIYAGTGFSDSALPPVPYIVAKQIPEQTDASGRLNIKIRVRAGE